VLECNHEASMLAQGDYPYRLKQRIGGRFGHLSNEDAATLLGRLDNSCLQHIVAAHLSHKNNSAELAVQALSGALDRAPDRISVATQEQGLDWIEIA
jgi:phosphoribosyl 1,2-cyclic phosphodiesterase